MAAAMPPTAAVNPGARITLVFGAPGTGRTESLEKYLRWRSSNAPESGQCLLIDLDAAVKEACLALNLKDEDGDALPRRPSMQLIAALGHHKLAASWREALESVAIRAIDASKTRDVLLVLYGTYFNPLHFEFYSPVDVRSLHSRLAGHVRQVVVLIDDIYDMRSRLPQSDITFIRAGNEREPYGQELALQGMLTWRSQEVAFAHHLALMFPCPCFVFAVKHPLGIFHRLVVGGHTTVYLSHHISSIRKASLADGALDSVAREQIAEVEGIATELAVRGLVVFEPTSIDEYRFLAQPAGEYPLDRSLGPRWPKVTPAEQLLWHEIVQRPMEHPKHADRAVQRGLVFALRNEISWQINQRDHALVRQSDLVYVHRPFLNGHSARGVQREMEYRHALNGDAANGRKTMVVFNPPADELARLAPAISAHLHSEQASGRISITSPEALDALRDGDGLTVALTGTPEDRDWSDSYMGLFKVLMERCNIDIELSTGSTLDGNEAYTRLREEDRFMRRLLDAVAPQGRGEERSLWIPESMDSTAIAAAVHEVTGNSERAAIV
ncbi:MAG: hypothetical protein IT347_01715 [Candidatus Eisenbacteria bacterium]|nr:hypothetical protein [Candidatus Eisenbacteria bacterium]